MSLESLASPDSVPEVRALALATLRDLAECAPGAFAPHAGIALPRILGALNDEVRRCKLKRSPIRLESA